MKAKISFLKIDKPTITIIAENLDESYTLDLLGSFSKFQVVLEYVDTDLTKTSILKKKNLDAGKTEETPPADNG